MSADARPAGSHTKLPCGSGTIQPPSRSAAATRERSATTPATRSRDLVDGGQARDRCGLGEAVDDERHERAIEHVDHLGSGDRVADTQRCQCVRLGEGPQQHDVREALDELHRVTDAGVGDELGVGLVDHDEARIGDTLDERRELVGADHGAGRVVGVGDQYQAGVVVDDVGEQLEVERLASQ